MLSDGLSICGPHTYIMGVVWGQLLRQYTVRSIST